MKVLELVYTSDVMNKWNRKNSIMEKNKSSIRKKSSNGKLLIVRKIVKNIDGSSQLKLSSFI